MAVLEKINVGIVGAVGRGGSFRETLASQGARIHAVCDTRAERLDECAQRFGATEKYSDYQVMLDRSALDAVVIGTPMHLHVPQCIAALKKNLHVLCEVTAGVSVDECRSLVKACQEARSIYMMAENYTYIKSNVMIRELVRRGLFGDVYYAEGEYLHDVKGYCLETPWRRHWQLGIDGLTYGTHSLGPILQWMPGDRIVKVCCEGSGSHYRDATDKPFCQDTSTMLAKTAQGRLIKIRVDLLSERPHAMTNYQLQGTRGAYESSRGAATDRDRIWLKELGDEVQWHDLHELAGQAGPVGDAVPEIWRNPPAAALRAGHGGGDYFEVMDFIKAIRGESECPIGIHAAMDMTLPGLVSQLSIAQKGAWLDVPDSRAWVGQAVSAKEQLRMIWPPARLSSPPPVTIPAGYILRQLHESDRPGYRELMIKAGFGDWSDERTGDNLKSALPGAFFVIEHQPSSKLVATAVATHHSLGGLPSSGELGWVAGDPGHNGKGLGFAVCSAVVGRFLEMGYQNIYLRTDDFRLPAIKVYLKMGFEPLLFCAGMDERWRAICQILKWP